MLQLNFYFFFLPQITRIFTDDYVIFLFILKNIFKIRVICGSFKTKKQPLKKEAVLTQKIVVRLSKSVYRFYEPLIFLDIDVCNKQTDNRN